WGISEMAIDNFKYSDTAEAYNPEPTKNRLLEDSLWSLPSFNRDSSEGEAVKEVKTQKDEIMKDWVSSLSKGVMPDDLKKEFSSVADPKALVESINQKLEQSAKDEHKEQRYKLDYNPGPDWGPVGFGVSPERVSFIDKVKEKKEAADYVESLKVLNPPEVIFGNQNFTGPPMGTIDTVEIKRPTLEPTPGKPSSGPSSVMQIPPINYSSVFGSSADRNPVYPNK
ncbi:MAG: hypothetical protein K2Z81_14145, partial [Cyanobacteria bacterium]|nr:hypothetical protein [Cyanobacteriota bacterium]